VTVETDGGTRSGRLRDEVTRTTAAVAIGTVAIILLSLLLPGRGNVWLTQLVYWDAFALSWLVLTLLGFRRTTAGQLAAWVGREDARATGWRGLVYGRSAASVTWLVALGGVYATVAAAFVLPRAEELSPRWSEALVLTGALAVVLAWLAAQTAYTLRYVQLDHRHPGGLSFPGDGAAPRIVDYAYFAFGVGTTFGTTDVVVLTSRLRRTVLLHNVYSFAFNTAVLAVAISTLAA
jgi:uncharacterized membrane protein